MTTPRAPLGQLLKQAAEAAGLTSEQVGQELGVSGATIRGWWMGRSEPPPSLLALYAEATGKPLAYFLGGETGHLDAAEQALIRQRLVELRLILGARVGRPWPRLNAAQQAGALAWLVLAVAGEEEEAAPAHVELLARVIVELGRLIAERVPSAASSAPAPSRGETTGSG